LKRKKDCQFGKRHKKENPLQKTVREEKRQAKAVSSAQGGGNE